MRMENRDGIAVYWDFDNIHLAVKQHIMGVKKGTRDPLVAIDKVHDFVKGFGTVMIHRAYADWTSYGLYKSAISAANIDTIQRFNIAGGGTKNGADIRLSLDVVDDLNRYGAIHTVVLVSGDSDFVPLASRIKQMGRRAVGIGVEESCSTAFVAACDEFKFYRTLITTKKSTKPPQICGDDLLEPFQLVERAYAQLVEQTDVADQNTGTVKAMMKRLDPKFDEKSLGFSNFTAFLQALPGRVSMTGVGDAGPTTMALLDEAPDRTAASDDSAGGIETDDDEVARRYRELLSAHRFNIPARRKTQLWQGIVCFHEAVSELTGSYATPELASALKETLDRRNVTVSSNARSMVVVAAAYFGEMINVDAAADEPTCVVESSDEMLIRILSRAATIVLDNDGDLDVSAFEAAFISGVDDVEIYEPVDDAWERVCASLGLRRKTPPLAVLHSKGTS